jgi:hypothetical protein
LWLGLLHNASQAAWQQQRLHPSRWVGCLPHQGQDCEERCVRLGEVVGCVWWHSFIMLCRCIPVKAPTAGQFHDGSTLWCLAEVQSTGVCCRDCCWDDVPSWSKTRVLGLAVRLWLRHCSCLAAVPEADPVGNICAYPRVST